MRAGAIIVRLLPLVVVVAAFALAYALGLHRYFTWTYLAAHEQALRALAASRPLSTAAGFVLVYLAVVAVSLPVGVWLTLLGGALFGIAIGAALSVVGATLGAVLLFLATRSAIGPLLADRAGPLLDRVREGLSRNGFSYLLAIRLVPVVPFWLTNLAPGIVGMRLAPFALATLIGIIPGTAVFAGVGAGLGDVLARSEPPDLKVIFAPAVLLPLLALALLALTPIAWRRWRSSRAPAASIG